MYDPETAALIRRVRAIRGVSPDNLPERLTDAFTQLVGYRMAMTTSRKVSAATIRSLRQMANVYELEAILTEERDRRRAAAFVSGTAHRLLAHSALAGLVAGTAGLPLDRTGISPALSAGLLFLIAGYFADAAEICTPLRSANPSTIESSLADAVARFVCGDMRGVLDATIPNTAQADSDTEEATTALWREVFIAVQLMAERFATAPNPDRDPLRQALARLKQVAVSSVESLALEAMDGPRVLSTFAGPHHLATLLISAANTLGGSAVIDLPPPPDVDSDVWNRFVTDLATRRPFLWPNHLKALAVGYSNPGVSSVLSFPTGAGKSTLAEIKMATALARGHKVVFLAPTLALVAQCVETFRRAFPSSTTRDSMIGEGFFAAVDDPELPDIAVMTPERCLFLLGLNAPAFSDVGLIVFDECHLLHPAAADRDRRAVDAMLCLLGTIEAAPSADVVLLSAMMANADELSKWLASVTQRATIALDLEWKPTRQARGCVVYDSSGVSALRQGLLKERRAKKTKAPSASAKRQLVAQAHGLFALKHTWASSDQEDYRIVSLLDDPVVLGANPQWRLTANKNGVAMHLGQRLAGLGIKTIIFTQDRPQTESICRSLNELDTSGNVPTFTAEEQVFLRQAESEMGSRDHVVMPEGTTAVCHHSLLLPSERHLSESLFRRDAGCSVIVATPTLSQGMNLPAGAVIIAGEQRYDPSTEDAARVQAHELLNAAGRAGRAGHTAMGLVIVVPSDLITFTSDKKGLTPGKEWFDLRDGIFAKTDHCLTIDDPIEHLLDRLHLADEPEGRNIRYFLNRLPLDDSHSDRTTRLLNRSLGAFRAGQSGAASEFAAKVKRASVLRRKQATSDPAMAWSNRLASSTGIPANLLQSISTFVGPSIPQWTVLDCLDRTLEWLFSSKALLFNMLPLDGLAEVFSEASDTNVKGLRGKFAQCCKLWVSGAPLRDVESLVANPGKSDLGRCVRARKFTRRVIVDLVYAAGLFPQVIRERSNTTDPAAPLPLGLLVGPSCIRHGYDRPELLALEFATRGSLSRVEIHRIGAAVDSSALATETSFIRLQRGMKLAYEEWATRQHE
jgi:superfamily II DNA/RNA helicase